MDDAIIWPYDKSKRYTVKSFYKILNLYSRGSELAEHRKIGLGFVWGATVPSKVKFFGWRLLMDRLPTRKQLRKRGIILQQQDAVCVFCHLEEEDINHLMLSCATLKPLWRKICSWLELDMPTNLDCCSHMLSCIEKMSGKMARNRAGAVWLTICWGIWKYRNDIVFNNAVVDIDELFVLIIFSSWWWLAIDSRDRILSSFYDWFHNPFLCL
ncbi:uncharacterized protein LOC131597176 [Vicia villosa]|uniref:uncharacterized protein LOC131597176 n=1 Tax=Vicia villosa TaxID=3911 RepID=UPI00273B3D90|nr:uncharacterized protein LOC131597176 [Vicia villosa]